LKEQFFYFFSTSYFAQTIHGDIFPAEIALAKFNLKDGVCKTLNMLVNPGKLPLGKAADAMDLAKATHKRDLPPNIEGKLFAKQM